MQKLRSILLLATLSFTATTAFAQSQLPPDDKKFSPIEPEPGRYITYTGKYLEMWKLDAWLLKVQNHYANVRQIANAPDSPAEKPNQLRASTAKNQ